MAAGVIYLDIDDEITSAATRIRTVEERRVAVVLPYGSRVATSRINFRLLARDALTHEKRLSIIAGDAATRALAASAGLPVYATIQEYEGALEAEGTAAQVEAAVAPAAPSAPATDDGPSPPPERPRRAGRAAGPVAPPSADVDGRGAGEAADLVSGATTRTVRSGGAVGGAAPGSGSRPAEPRVRPGPGRPGALAGGRPRVATPIVAGILLLALAVVVGGVGAYLLLPSAEVVVTPREEIIGPLAFRAEARTDVSEPDVDAGILPAQPIVVSVEASGTFAATGERVEETAATGLVRFENRDPTTSNTITEGAIVSTNNGTRFRTDRSVTIAAATLVGLMIRPSFASVTVTAVDPGPEGNVQPNAITTVPRGEEPIFLKVTNPDETTGGARETFARVSEEDVQAAQLALATRLEADFAARLDDPDIAPDAVTVFPETASPGEPEWSVDVETLVGTEAPTFDLGGSLTGSVLAVDTAPLQAIAEARLAASVSDGFRLIEGSSEVSVDPAVVAGARITFPVRTTARQVAVLDPAVIAERIRGLPLADAQAILDTYGTASVRVWPDWVATIPTLDGRLSVTIQEPGS
ncbi:MAG: baseplate J/gp47 family protein [Candidatus Limnocylindria bacterium]